MSENAEVDRLASQCVKCALCLPHCPTYQLTQDENESPRGRIALMQALAQEKLPLTAKAKQHIDQCLGCRACEAVCPAHVEYGKLLVHGRSLIKAIPPQIPLPPIPRTTRFLSTLVTHSKALNVFHWLLWGLEKTGLRRFARKLKLPSFLGLKRQDELLPQVFKPRAFAPHYQAIGKTRGRVMCFTGCMTTLTDQETLTATLFLLRRLGYEVTLPPKQTCCGAIALHDGDLKTAQGLAEQNVKAFLDAAAGCDHIVTVATGCSAVLKDYDSFFSSQSNSKQAEMSAFSHKIIDIMEFLHLIEWPSELVPQPLKLRVILHTPCTQRNVLKSSAYPEQHFARIPQLEWKTFASPACCGAAGTYMLNHPDFAEPLAQKLLSELDNIHVDFCATSNIGCALHLQQQLKKRHLPITVGHPITLLARAYGFCENSVTKLLILY